MNNNKLYTTFVLTSLVLSISAFAFIAFGQSNSSIEKQGPSHGYRKNTTQTGSLNEKKTDLQKLTEDVVKEVEIEKEDTPPVIEEEAVVAPVAETKKEEVKVEVKTAVTEEVKPEVKSEVKSEVKPEIKPAVKEEKKEVKKETQKAEVVQPVPQNTTIKNNKPVAKEEKKVEQPKTTPQQPVNKKEVMLAPEKTIIRNGEVVNRKGNEDYRDLDEERMIEDVLSSGLDRRVSSYEELEIVDKRTGPTVRYVEEDKPVVPERDLAEEGMLDTLLQSGN